MNQGSVWLPYAQRDLDKLLHTNTPSLRYNTGLDLYDRLHQLSALRQQPAIMLTAVGRNEQMEWAAAQRQIEMLAKPFEIEDFLRCIEQPLS